MDARKELLAAAEAVVTGQRQQDYGSLEQNFGLIADLWSAYLGPHGRTALRPSDVAVMMALLKTARLAANPAHWDSWLDLAGYAACGAEVAGAGRPAVLPRESAAADWINDHERRRP